MRHLAVSRTRLRSLAAGVALGAFLLAAGAVPAAHAQNAPHNMTGHLAPAFALKDFQNHIVHLSQYRGKVVLLNFWASWCAPCQAEMPTFVQWQNQYHGKLQVIGVNMDDETPKAEAVARKLKINYPLVVGTAKLGNTYGGIYGLPVSVVIDAHGRIRGEYQGGNHVTEIHAEIEHLLAHTAR